MRNELRTSATEVLAAGWLDWLARLAGSPGWLDWQVRVALHTVAHIADFRLHFAFARWRTWDGDEGSGAIDACAIGLLSATLRDSVHKSDSSII